MKIYTKEELNSKLKELAEMGWVPNKKIWKSWGSWKHT